MSEARGLFCGAGRADITPPLEVGILMSSMQRRWARFEAVREPLFCRVILLREGRSEIAIVSLDLLGLAGAAVEGWRKFTRRVAAAGGVAAERLIITSTHTHNGPETLALTDLYRTAAYRRWREKLIEAMGEALREARRGMKRCHVFGAVDATAGLTVYRRVLTTEGIVLSNPPPDPRKILRWTGPTDERVRVLSLRNENGGAIVTLVNAVCHPIHEMCLPQVSADYPGEVCRRVEGAMGGGLCMFLNGAAGNINPVLVSDGAGGSMAHGKAVAEAVVRGLGRLERVEGGGLRMLRRRVKAGARTRSGRPSAIGMEAEIVGLRVGGAGLLFLPGEPFVEMGLGLLSASGFALTLLAGYAGEWIGYLATREAFSEGGYETGPGDWSRLAMGATERIGAAALRMLAGL